MSNSIEIWKIRQKSSGLFSRGGTLRHPYDDSRAWSKKGKSWKQINHLRSHLNLAASFYRQQQADIEVVKLVMIIDEKNVIPMQQFLDERDERHQERNNEREQRRREFRLAEIESEQKRLKRELKDLKG